MNRHMKRPSTFSEILSGLAAAGRPVTVQNALMVMVGEMNQVMGTDIKATKRDLGPQTDAERRADIERTLALMDKMRLQLNLPPEAPKGATN